MNSLVKEIKSLKRKTPNQVVLVVLPAELYADQPKNVLPLLKAHANKVAAEGESVGEFKADRIFYVNPEKIEHSVEYLQTVLVSGGRLTVLSVEPAAEEPEAPAAEQSEECVAA